MTRQATIVVGLAGLLLFHACGGEGNQAGDEAAETDGSRRNRPEPRATDVEEVRPYIVELLDEHDYVVDQILADPSIAGDRDSLLIQRYVDVYEPESPIPDQLIAAWVEMGEAGEHVEPYEPGLPVNATSLDGEIEAVSDDEVQFSTCNEQGHRTYGSDGQVTDEQPYQQLTGEGVAVRVDGEWRLRRIDTFDQTGGCASPGEEGQS
jgi:hypothetical protein